MDVGAASRAFGISVFDRFRIETGTDGQFRIIALTEHLRRTNATALFLGAPVDPERKEKWKSWIVATFQAYVREFGVHGNLYGDISFGQFEVGDSMMKGGKSADWTTYIWISSVPPLYGEKAHLASDLSFAKSPSYSTVHKISGPYADFWISKRKVRESVAGTLPPGAMVDQVESVLYGPRASLDATCWDMPVCEGGSSALLAHGRGNAWHFSGEVRFPSITEQICREIILHEMQDVIAEDLRRDDLLMNSATVGTACRVTPVTWFDGEPVGQGGPVEELAEYFHQLCQGKLSVLSNRWTTTLDV